MRRRKTLQRQNKAKFSLHPLCNVHPGKYHRHNLGITYHTGIEKNNICSSSAFCFGTQQYRLSYGKGAIPVAEVTTVAEWYKRSPARMLMCHKVTHKNLIDSCPLFQVAVRQRVIYKLSAFSALKWLWSIWMNFCTDSDGFLAYTIP